jgi:hypothetical protein
MVLPQLRRSLSFLSVISVSALVFAAPSVAAEPPSTSGIVERESAGDALAAAREFGRPVRIADQMSETSESFALPTGEIETTISAGVVRIRQGGDWVPVDLTLRPGADGNPEPVAHPADLRLAGKRLSPEGTLASIDTAAGPVSLGWDGALPEPTLSGNRATYSEVKPGVDLVVDATREGFEQFLILKSPAAAKQVDGLSLPLHGPGFTDVTEAPDGGLELTDQAGKVVAVAPTPLMWDAQTSANGESPARSAQVALEAVESDVPRIHTGTDAELTLSPDKAWLADPRTKYPVTVDPQINKLLTYFDTTVMEGITADRGGADYLQLGVTTEAKPKRARSFVKWNVSDLRGKEITSSRAYFYNWYSTTCTSTAWEIWTTEAADADTRWADQPKWLRKEATSTETKGLNSSCGDGWVSIDAKSFFQYAADKNQTYANMGLKASNEADKKQWKEFRSRNAANTAQVPYAKVTYADKPAETSTYGMKFAIADPDQAIPGGADRNAEVMQAWTDSRPEWPAVSGSKGEAEASVLSRSDTDEASFLAAQQEPTTDLPTYEVEVEDEALDSYEPDPGPDADVDPSAEVETAPEAPLPSAPSADGTSAAESAGMRALSASTPEDAPETDTPPDESEWITDPEADPGYEPVPDGQASASAAPRKPHEDWMTTGECRTGWRNHKPRKDTWYYKNKFSFCQITSAYIWFNKCTGSRCEYSDVTFNIMYVGAGSHSKRATNWNAYIYDWSQVNKPDLAVPFTIDVRCQAFYSAKCYAKGGAVRKSLAAWKAAPKFSKSFTTKAFKPTADDPKFREKRSFHQFKPVHSDPVHNIVNVGAGVVVRCDLAKYLGRKKVGGCIGSDVIGTMILNYKSTKYAESVHFIWQAMFRLGTLDSAKAGKFVPGGAYQQPVTGKWESLSRDYWSSVRHNRGRVQAECRRLYGANYADGGKDCDEYPFAATFESANRIPSGLHPWRTFAVKALNKRHNSSSGATLLAFYNRDHVLHGDRFYVSIRNGPAV